MVTFAQVDLNDYNKHENKIFQISKLEKIQSRYIGLNGLYSRDRFLKEHGLYPQNEKKLVQPRFVVSCQFEDPTIGELPELLKNRMKVLNTDFYLETTRLYESKNEYNYIWDARVYQDESEIVVGAYSYKFNERPVAVIDEHGNFVSSLEGEFVQEFPLLKVPANQIVFDPFEWKLLKVSPSAGKQIQKTTREYLPVDVTGKYGELIHGIHFELEVEEERLILYGIISDKRYEIASSEINTMNVLKATKGYDPDIIEGCSQIGNGKVVTYVLNGDFSEEVKTNNGYLQIDKEIDSRKEDLVKNPSVRIDGDFTEWRNIQGVSDYEGDFVSYLYKNPDTDLLEVKVTNDDKYIYFYSRVAGAHGRTGERGRYYWYSYIDVDQNVNTGYPPTRGDNCYFGVHIGDDSEAQFEFVGNKFIKTFFGFTGIGAEKEALSGTLNLGASHYSKTGMAGIERDSYKVEYVNRKGSRSITHDNTEGTSEDIVIALSPDGSEVEVKALLSGFLKGTNGEDILYKGKRIDLSIGVEGSSDHYGSEDWGADSSPIIFDYHIK